MKWKTKWIAAIVLAVGVIGVAKLESAGVIGKPVTQYVTTGKDFLAMKKWVASMMSDPEVTIVSGDAEPMKKILLPCMNRCSLIRMV